MKFKKIPCEYSNIICDKLTRFKPARDRFKILFDDILNKFYLESNLSALNDLQRAEIALEIINHTFLSDDFDNQYKILFQKIENQTFQTDTMSDFYLSLNINYTSLIKSLDISKTDLKSLLWLKILSENIIEPDLEFLREKYELLYPIKGIILCEGQTEYTLLNNIFNLYQINLDKIGFMIIPAGGKNQVARKYYELSEYLKLPVFILLDSDAIQTKELIDSKIQPKDKLYLINSGEFEDLIPKRILLNTINSVHNNDYTCNFDDFDDSIPMSHNLALIYKKYGYGEFKKAQFAKQLNEYILQNCSKDDFSNSETDNIIKEFSVFIQ